MSWFIRVAVFLVKFISFFIPGVLYTSFLYYYGPIENDAFENSSSGDFARVLIGASLVFWAMVWANRKSWGKWLSIIVFSLVAFNLCFSFTSWYYYDSPFGSIGALTVLDGNQQASQEFLSNHWMVFVFFVLVVVGSQFAVSKLANLYGEIHLGRPSAIMSVLWFSIGIYADFVMNPAYDNTGVFKSANMADFLSKTPLYNGSHLLYAYDSKSFVVKAMKRRYEFPNVQSNLSDEIHVVMIGESGRRDRHSLYGYERQTTPYMDAIKNELMIFTNANAPSTQSVISAATSLSETKVTGIGPRQLSKNIVALSRQAGYTTSWISVPGLNFSRYNNFISAIGRQANIQVDLMDQYDTAVIPEIAKIISMPGPKVIFVHLLGSHPMFSERYPEEFSVFTDGNAGEYDNTILYNDFMLNEVINLLRDKNSTLMYFTDHGLEWDEGEQRFRHGGLNPPASVFEVPFWVWYSKHYKSPNLGLEVDTDVAFGLEDLFYFLAWHLGISYEGQDKCRSPLENCYIPEQIVVRGLDGVPVSLADLD